MDEIIIFKKTELPKFVREEPSLSDFRCNDYLYGIVTITYDIDNIGKIDLENTFTITSNECNYQVDYLISVITMMQTQIKELCSAEYKLKVIKEVFGKI